MTTLRQIQSLPLICGIFFSLTGTSKRNMVENFLQLPEMVGPTAVHLMIKIVSVTWMHICENSPKPSLMKEQTFTDMQVQNMCLLTKSIRSVVYSSHISTIFIRFAAYSLLDLWEYESGFTTPYGLVHVDRDCGEYTRRFKASAHWYADVAGNHVIP